MTSSSSPSAPLKEGSGYSSDSSASTYSYQDPPIFYGNTDPASRTFSVYTAANSDEDGRWSPTRESLSAYRRRRTSSAITPPPCTPPLLYVPSSRPNGLSPTRVVALSPRNPEAHGNLSVCSTIGPLCCWFFVIPALTLFTSFLIIGSLKKDS
jgi:hypothetical protein